VAIASKNVSAGGGGQSWRESVAPVSLPLLKLQEVSDDAVGELAVRKSVGAFS